MKRSVSSLLGVLLLTLLFPLVMNANRRPINTKGDLQDDQKRSASTSSVEIFLDEDVLSLQFLRNVDVVTVKVYNSTGAVVSEETMSTSSTAFTSFVLPTNDCYVIRITNTYGQLEGSFCVD